MSARSVARMAACALLSVVAATSQPAAAQLSPGTSGFSSAPVSASEAEFWVLVRRVGLCFADSKVDQSRAFLAADPGSPEEDAAIKTLFHRQSNPCMGNFISASFPRAYIRGSVAEGFVKMMPDAQRAALLAGSPGDDREVRTMHDFARCYVARHPAIALQFLADTKLASKGEEKAVRQMAAEFGPCLPAGREVKINPTDIRMAIAEALYHAANRSAGTMDSL